MGFLQILKDLWNSPNIREIASLVRNIVYLKKVHGYDMITYRELFSVDDLIVSINSDILTVTLKSYNDRLAPPVYLKQALIDDIEEATGYTTLLILEIYK